ncbi:MAG TPA: hypothetical protein VF789_14470 [Thermoanaerobaculia bacterium]
MTSSASRRRIGLSHRLVAKEAEMTTRDLDRIRFVTRHFHDLQGLRYWVPIGLLTLSVGGTTYFANRPYLILRSAFFLAAFLLFFGARWYYRRSFGEVERQPVLPAAEVSTLSVFSPAGPTQGLASSPEVARAARSFSITMGAAFVLFLILQALSPSFRITADESLVQQPWRTMWAMVSFSVEEVKSSADLVPMSRSTAKALYGQALYALFGSFFLGMWFWRERRLSQSYHLVFGILLLWLAILGASLGFFYLSPGRLAPIIAFFEPTLVHLWMALLLCGSSMILAGLLDHWQLARALGQREK